MNNSLVSELFYIMRRLHGIRFLFQVGLERNLAKGKVDLLAGCNEGSIDKYSHSIKILLKDRWPTGNFFVCDDSVRFNLPVYSGGIAVCDSILIVRQIKEWIKGKNLNGRRRPWVVGYWLPEALCGDLTTARILYDVANVSVQIKELLIPYPVSLSKAIIKLCTSEIKQKISIFDKLRKDAIIERELCLSDIRASMIRLAFARSRRYFRGFRSLEKQSKLLEPSDALIYQLSLKLSDKEEINNTLNEIRRLF